MNPYAPKAPSDGLGEHISRLAVATIVPIFALFVLRLILASLPMIKNAAPIADLGVTPLLLIKAAIDTVIYFLILRFALVSSGYIKGIRTHLEEVANIVTLAGCALVATLAYSGYELLVGSLAPTQMEVYNWVFLGAVLTPIALIVMIVVRRMDFFSNLLFGKLSQATAMPAGVYSAGQAAGVNPGFSPAWSPAPPQGMPPGVDPAQEQLRARVTAIRSQVNSAKEAAERLQSAGKLNAELAESASKMMSYLDGAVQSLEGRDLNAAKGFADWAEYEATRVLSAAN